MTHQAKGSFNVVSWDEKPYVEIDDARKLTQASVTQEFHGDIEGDGWVEWLMCYRTDGTADWLGLQRIVGRLQNRSGSFVLRTGVSSTAPRRGEWSVVSGSGTDELRGLTGTGQIESPIGTEASYVLDYTIDA